MAWIESHQSLKDHPKLLDLCGILQWDQDVAIGKVHRLWWWCLDYAVDGDLRRFNDSQIALGMGVAIPEARRVVEALVQARWLEREPYFRVRNWWQYVGRFLQIKWKNNEDQWKRVRVLYQEGSKEPPLELPLQLPKEQEPNQPTKPNLTNRTNQTNSLCAPSALRLRINKWFRRRPNTHWGEKELKALKKVEALDTPEDEIALLERYYLATDIPQAVNYRRRNIETLLNNWNGEIDRARAYRPSKPSNTEGF